MAYPKPAAAHGSSLSTSCSGVPDSLSKEDRLLAASFGSANAASRSSIQLSLSFTSRSLSAHTTGKFVDRTMSEKSLPTSSQWPRKIADLCTKASMLSAKFV